jgi:hypothetical protein
MVATAEVKTTLPEADPHHGEVQVVLRSDNPPNEARV